MQMDAHKPGRIDRISWTIAAVAVAVAGCLMAMNFMVDVGAAAHDAFCVEHGWAV